MSQISRIKHKQGIKLVNAAPDASVPNLNLDLRRLGFNDEEVVTFWASTPALRLRKQMHEDQQRFLAQHDSYPDPLAPVDA
jgi:hypothetical protein